MRREEYLYTLTEQIRCKMARGTIEQEINDHIEDQKAEFLSEGMSQTEAEEAAVRVGADFRLKCVGCGHQIMVARKLVEKNTRQIVKRT